MYSYIIQLSKSPLKEDEYIVEADYHEGWFGREIADFITNTDREKAISELKYLERKGIKIGKDDNGDYLYVIDKEKYFECVYEEFKDVLLDLSSSYSFKQFISDDDGELNYSLWRLREAYEHKYDLYIDMRWGDPMPLDAFVRRAAEGAKVYIGNILAYHS